MKLLGKNYSQRKLGHQIFSMILSFIMLISTLFVFTPARTVYALESNIFDDLKNSTTVVYFNNMEWYLIDYDNYSVTLLLKNPYTLVQYVTDYGMPVENTLNNMFSILFNNTRSATVSSWFLLTAEQANMITNPEVKKCSYDWWLCSQGINDNYRAYVDGDNGGVIQEGKIVTSNLGLRPALKLKLASVVFSPDSNTFSYGIGLDKTKYQMAAIGDVVSFTAGFSSDSSADKTVKWSVNNPDVKLYSDSECTDEISYDTAISNLTVYAKSSDIAEAEISVKSNDDQTRNASCKISFSRIIEYKVTFIVNNGSWDDGTKTDKVVTLSRLDREDCSLLLEDSDIPSVGSSPDYGFKAGSWDEEPRTDMNVSKDITYTYTYAKKDCISHKITFKVENGSWDDGTTADKTVTLTGYEGDTLKLASDQIPSVGSKPGDAYKTGTWDVTPSTDSAITNDVTYTYTYADKDSISKKVTFKVTNGSWDDGTKADKTVTLTGYEGDVLKLTSDQIPSVGSKPGDIYKTGTWDTTPSASTAITADTTYTYTYAKKDSNSAVITFKVANGSWDDGTTADKTVTLSGYEGDTLKLSSDQIPSVGSKPNDSYKEGSWDKVVNVTSAITEDVTYTYTYVEDKKEEKPEDKKEDYRSEWVDGQWYDANGGTDYKPQGSWRENGTGKWYEDTAGWYPVSTWQKIDGDWYYFNSAGYMATNEYCGTWNPYEPGKWWVGADGKWDGSSAAIWSLSGSKWWFGTADASWYAYARWLKIDGFWYYFDGEGYLLTNQYIGEYWVNSDGQWVP